MFRAPPESDPAFNYRGTEPRRGKRGVIIEGKRGQAAFHFQ